MNPEVSILLPTFNGEKTLARAIESVLSQDFISWELIIIDDGSTDRTKQIIEAYGASDKRIRYLKNETNLGIQKSLNYGLQEAQGVYIARIDDDDRWIDSKKLTLQVSYMKEHPKCSVVGTWATLADKEGRELYRYQYSETDRDIRKSILMRNPFAHPAVLFRADRAREAGGYPESQDTLHVEDYDLWLRLGTRGEFANLSDYAVALTAHSGSLSAKNRIVQFRRSLRLIWRYRDSYPRVIIALLLGTARLVLFRFFSLFPEWFRREFLRYYKSI